MKRRTIIGAGVTGILAVVGALLFWPDCRLSVLTSAELKMNHANPKPPPHSVRFTESYGDMPRRLCGKPEPLIDTNVCDVVRLPDLFADKCIRVTGWLETDGLEHSDVVDESCREHSLVLRTTSQTETKPSIVKLGEDTRRYGRVGTHDLRITGRFTGHFMWRPNGQREPRVLEISSVGNLKVKRVLQK